MKSNYLSKLKFWNKLTSEEQEELSRNSVIKEYKKGTIIHSENNECLGMMILIQGEIRTCIVSDIGNSSGIPIIQSLRQTLHTILLCKIGARTFLSCVK